MRRLLKLLLTLVAMSGALFAEVSYRCTFDKKVSYSSMRDRTPNRVRYVNMHVIYHIDGRELLTRPTGVNETFSAWLQGKWLDRFGDLYYIYKSNIGYMYGLTEDRRHVIEMTPSGKTVLKGYCIPLY